MDKKVSFLDDILTNAIREKKYDTIKNALEKIDDSQFYTLLKNHLDTPEVDENLADLLLNSKRIDINQVINSENHTILHALSYHGHVKILEDVFKRFEDVKVDAKCRKGRTPFILAAMKNQVEVLSLLQEKHANINEDDNNGWGALHYAACTDFQGHLQAVKKLIALGANVNRKDYFGETPLIKAAKKGIREIVSVLMQAGADADIKCKQDNTALDHAAKKWNSDCVKFLIEKTKDINKRDGQGKTLLMKAALVGDTEVLSSLLSRGADADVLCNKNFHALQYAVNKGHLDCIKILAKHTTAINLKDGLGQTILIRAAGHGKAEVVSCLIEFVPHIDINVKCSDHRSALDYAAWNGHLKCVETLVKNGADIESRDVNGQTPLIKAAGFGHVEVVEFLLKCGAQVDNVCDKKRTALNYACYNGKLDCAKKLIEYKADIHSRDSELQTPLFKAAGFGNAELVKLLITLGADVHDSRAETSVLGFAARNGTLDCVKILIENGADINYKSKSTAFTSFIEASVQGNVDVLEYLFSLNIDIDQTCQEGRTALLHSSYFGHLKCVEFLVENGADLERRDVAGQTALLKAVGKDHCDVVAFLLEKGADVSVVEEEGRNAMIRVARTGCLKCAKKLVHRGADINRPRQWLNETPLMIAVYYNYPEMVSFLVENGANIYLRNDQGWTAMEMARRFHPNMLDLIRKFKRGIW